MDREVMLSLLDKGLRQDRRAFDAFRPIEIQTDVSKSAEGSARVKLGQTEVLVGVKLAVEPPYLDLPNEGKLVVNAELLALSSPSFEPGPPSSWSIELARVVDRGIREAKTIDLQKLCISPGEKVWSVTIDICSINDAGNLLDASSLGAIAALKNTFFPKYEGGIINYLEKTSNGLPLLHVPIAVTVYKIGPHFIIDPSIEEEELADARLTVTIMENGQICALQKGGAEALSFEEIEKAVEIAAAKQAELRDALAKALPGPKEPHAHPKMIPYR